MFQVMSPMINYTDLILDTFKTFPSDAINKANSLLRVGMNTKYSVLKVLSADEEAYVLKISL